MMTWFLDLLSPSGPLNEWAVRATLICWGPLLLVWLIAIPLARCSFLFGQDPLVRSYLSWLIPLTAYAALMGTIAIHFSAVLQRTGGLFAYSLFPFIPFVVACLLALSIATKLGSRAVRIRKLA